MLDGLVLHVASFPGRVFAFLSDGFEFLYKQWITGVYNVVRSIHTKYSSIENYCWSISTMSDRLKNESSLFEEWERSVSSDCVEES